MALNETPAPNRPLGLDDLDSVFNGSLVNLPEKESSVVRIFLSSTFTDMQVERNWLMKHAVPDLRTFCQERGLDFQIADMRWGVREDATDDHRTTELCLHEIRNCQRVSVGPNFVAFLGDKYGYRPIPSEIEASEFKLLKKTATKLNYDTSLLLSWYLCDYNREPNVYTLQPISSQFPAYFDMSPANASQRQQAQREWWGVLDKLTTVLRESAVQLHSEGQLSEEDKRKYFQSVTEHEVSVGILQAEDIEDKVLCFERTFVDINIKDAIAGRFIDLTENSLDQEAEKLRAELCMVKIPERMSPAQLYRYNIPWDKLGVNIYKTPEHISYMETLGGDFVSSIKRMVSKAKEKKVSSRPRSEFFEELLHHLHFCRSKCQVFCGRQNLLKDIRCKLSALCSSDHKPSDHKPSDGTVLNGETDSTHNDNAERILKERRQMLAEERQMMRQALREMCVTYTLGDGELEDDADPEANSVRKLTEIPLCTQYGRPVIVYGASGSGKTALVSKAAELSKTWFPGSVLMLRYLGTSAMSTTVREVLVGLCVQIWEAYRVQRPTGIDLGSDFQFLIRYFAALLWKINTSERELVIVLDSVDQLSNTDHAHMLHWIPHKLPPGVHMLVSVVSDRVDCLKNARLLFPDTEQYVEVDQMESIVASEVISQFCQCSNRHLSKKQKNFILNQFDKCSQPLYLKLLLDMSLSWKSFTNMEEQLVGVTVQAAINHLFNSLERNHGTEIVKKGIGYMCAAREGLTENEIEDLLSLDDEVLQDTYIYHLPPDPDVVRLPPLLWKRIQFDISEYIVERQSGGKKVITWYHRQFVETTRQRYLTAETRHHFHVLLSEYFQGIWSDKAKPLKLVKGKKGNFQHALRQVPAQPIKFSASLYNTRKLSELPYHLIQSGQFQRVLSDLFCDPAWMHAKCVTMSFTALMEDLRQAEQVCAGDLEQQRSVSARQAQLGQQGSQTANGELKIKEEVFEGLQLVIRMVLQASDNIRKDLVTLPQTILAQLGPDYRGNVYVEKLVQRCVDWCRDSPHSLLVPSRECMSRPGGVLLYTIDVEVALTGEKRDKGFVGSYLREDMMQLYAVKFQSAPSDQLCVFDLTDNGSCITADDLSLFVRSVRFVGKNRYLLLDVYTKKDQFDPMSEHSLYESSFASPVTFDPKPKLIAVSKSGKIIACSSEGGLVTVYKADKYLQLQKCQTYQVHQNDVSALIISQDETFVITSDVVGSTWNRPEGCKTVVYNLRNKTHFEIDESILVSMQSLVTSSGLLVTTKSAYRELGTLVVYDLLARTLARETVINETYGLDELYLHQSEKFVLVIYKDTGVVNGIRDKYAELVDISTGEKYGRCPEEYIGPYLSGMVFGADTLYYAICQWNRSEVPILFAGYVNSPLHEAVVVHVLTGHNQPVREILVPTNLDILLTVANDNTIKVWDLKSVLGKFSSELAAIEGNLAKKAQQEHDQYSGTDPRSVELTEVMEHYQPSKDTTKSRSKTTCVAFNRFADAVYVGTDDGILQMYDVDSAQLKLSTQLDVGPICHLVLSSSGQYMISAGKTKIHIEDLQSQEHRVLESRGNISCLAENNNILVAGSAGMEAKGRVWNIQTGKVVKDFELLYSFYCVAINKFGTKVVSSMFDFPVIVQLDDSVEEIELDQSKVDTNMNSGICCRISPDDELAALSSGDGSVRVMTMEGKYKYRLQQRSSAVALAFTADSKQLLSAGYRTIYVWSMTDGSRRCKLSRHTDFVNSLMFDDSGRYLVSISRDKQLILWDFNRMMSIASFQANCQIQAVDLASKAKAVAYIPEGVSELAILRPNRVLQNILSGNYQDIKLVPQVQALALAFSAGASAHTQSSLCSLM